VLSGSACGASLLKRSSSGVSSGALGASGTLAVRLLRKPA
jgi:hypothetical protein